MFNSDNLAIASHNQEIQVTFAEKPMMKIKSLKKQKNWYLIGTWLDRAFKGTNVNRVLPLVHGDWRLEIGDWTVLFSKDKSNQIKEHNKKRKIEWSIRSTVCSAVLYCTVLC